VLTLIRNHSGLATMVWNLLS